MPRSPGIQPYGIAALDRIRAKSLPNGMCWEWTGTLFNTGYGAIRLGTRATGDVNTYLVHRVAYQIMVVPLPSELKLDHLCRNRVCWNPDHLDPVTDRVNTMRGLNQTAFNVLKTHCPKGHPYSGDNLYQRPNSNDRRCRACGQRWQAERKARREAQRAVAVLPLFDLSAA